MTSPSATPTTPSATSPHDITAMMREIGEKAKSASKRLAIATSDQKVRALDAAAEAIDQQRDKIIVANETDMRLARQKQLSESMLDRLVLDDQRIDAMTAGIRSIALQPDPVGQIMESWQRPSGLQISRVRTPIGVVGVIYESRPNVTADAAALCIKSGNAVILRCGSESFCSSTAIIEAMSTVWLTAGLPEHSVQLIPTTDREAVGRLLTMTDSVDVIVPRGGRNLVARVQAEAKVPVFAHLEGIVHIYLDADADPQKTVDVVLNSKTRRPGICGAAECILIHRDYFDNHGDALVQKLLDVGVEVRGDETISRISGVTRATADDFGREFLEMKIAAKVVDSIDKAIEHIQHYGSQHTDCIMTENETTAQKFFQRLGSAILMHNASTQFADGGEFGMGAEIGIATGKLHARGPVGAQQLTTFQYHVVGNGTCRS